MTDHPRHLAPVAITPAHRVIIDGLGFWAARRMADSWDQLAIDAMATALDRLPRSGNAELDRLCAAGAELVEAAREHRRKSTEYSATILEDADWKASQAAREFFRARLAQSSQAMLGSQAQNVQAEGVQA